MRRRGARLGCQGAYDSCTPARKRGHSTGRPSLGVDVLNRETGCNEKWWFVEVSSGTSNGTDGTVNTKIEGLTRPLPFILAACGMNDASRMAAAVTEEPLLRLPL